MSKRIRKTYEKKKLNGLEIRSDTSIGTQQLQSKAARSTENKFSQMLSRSK
jgi:hypothetical protein